jgi:hypothetical protein
VIRVGRCDVARDGIGDELVVEAGAGGVIRVGRCIEQLELLLGLEWEQLELKPLGLEWEQLELKP